MAGVPQKEKVEQAYVTISGTVEITKHDDLDIRQYHITTDYGGIVFLEVPRVELSLVSFSGGYVNLQEGLEIKRDSMIIFLQGLQRDGSDRVRFRYFKINWKAHGPLVTRTEFREKA